MRFHFTLMLQTLLLLPLLIGCGGPGHRQGRAPDPDAEETDTEGRMTSQDMIPRAVLVRAEFTREVDLKRFKATGEILEEFDPTVEVIYLAGKLKRVPTQARIEVRWFRDSVRNPILISDIHGSGRFSFVADFRPVDEEFIPGPHTARVFVNGAEVGGASFTITGEDPFAARVRVRKPAVSTRVTRKMKPRQPAKAFKEKTKKLHVTFDIENAVPGTEVTVRWLRNGDLFNEQEVGVAPRGRFGSVIESPAGLPSGNYVVEIEVNGESKAETRFAIGEVSDGPAVDLLALGLALGGDNLPTVEQTVFKVGHPAVKCGLRFLDVPPESIVEVRWIRLEEDSESTWHTTRTAVTAGGSGTLSAVWEADGSFTEGQYKVVVLINGVAAAEKEFAIE